MCFDPVSATALLLASERGCNRGCGRCRGNQGDRAPLRRARLQMLLLLRLLRSFRPRPGERGARRPGGRTAPLRRDGGGSRRSPRKPRLRLRAPGFRFRALYLRCAAPRGHRLVQAHFLLPLDP